MANTDKTYRGGCHCGAVQYEITSPEITKVMSCNCSICRRTGTLLTFVPAQHFKLIAGEAEVTDYQFNKRRLHHFFCKTCGIRSFVRGVGPKGEPTAAINVRCLEDVDLDQLEVEKFDGAKL